MRTSRSESSIAFSSSRMAEGLEIACSASTTASLSVRSPLASSGSMPSGAPGSFNRPVSRTISSCAALSALASEDSAAQLEMVRLTGRLKPPGAPDGMEPLLASGDRTLKLAVVDALQAISSPSAMRLLEKAIDDSDRDVRIAAVRFLAARGYRNAATRVEGAVTGGKLKNADLTEKMAFFEAFGSLVGGKAIAVL